MGQLTTLGERLRYFRELKGWTQTQLALGTSIGQTRISRIENERDKPYFWEVERLALYLEVPLGWLDTVRHRLERGAAPPAKAARRPAAIGPRRPGAMSAGPPAGEA